MQRIFIWYHEMSLTKCQVGLYGGWLGLRMAKFWDLKKSGINQEMVNTKVLPRHLGIKMQLFTHNLHTF